MAVSGDDITRYLSSQEYLDEVAKTARSNVAQRRIAEQAETSRLLKIGSGVDGSDEDLEVSEDEKLLSSKSGAKEKTQEE